MMGKPLYVICDASNSVAFLGDVLVLGREVSVPAIFASEDDALETLYSIEKEGLSDRSLRVRSISPTIIPVEA